MRLADQLPAAWRERLAAELAKSYFGELSAFLARERREHRVFPSAEQTFQALALVPPDGVRVVLLGQDPYHGAGQAHGLAFSVPVGVKPPPSLRNIFRELSADLDIVPAGHGCLNAWAKQGVLLLNAVLTVRAHQANSHRGRGWEQCTDAVIRAVSAGPNPVVFILWGGAAQKKQALIDVERHTVLTAPHPSPLSAHRGFFGSRPFSAANAALTDAGRAPVNWQRPSRDLFDASDSEEFAVAGAPHPTDTGLTFSP